MKKIVVCRGRMLPWRLILSASRSMRVKSCRWMWFLDHAAVFSVDSWSAIYSMNPLLNAPLPWSVSQDLAVESNWREKLYGALRKFDNKSPFSSNFLASINSSWHTTVGLPMKAKEIFPFWFFWINEEKLELKVSGAFFFAGVGV